MNNRFADWGTEATEKPAERLAGLQRRAAELAGCFSDMTPTDYYGETRAELAYERPAEQEAE